MPALLVNTISASPAASPRLPSLSRRTTTRRASTSSSRHRCRAEASASGGEGYKPGGVRGSWVSDYDLYELLGVERSSPQSEIKAAYRSLQKRCHPDVAGAADGHDMAIVLNEVYALLLVETSDLTALEFLISKQPRGRVRVSEGNAVGARAPNIFNELAKFQKRFDEMKQKSATRESQESETVRQSRTSAVHTIDPCQTGGTGAHSAHRRRPPSSSLRASSRRRRRRRRHPPLTPWRKGSKKLSPPGANRKARRQRPPAATTTGPRS